QSKEDHIALAGEFFRDALAAQAAGLEIIGADEEQAAAAGGVGVDGDDGNAGRVGGIDLRLQHGGVRNGDENAGGLGGNGLLQFGQLSLGIVAVRPGDGSGDVVL